jgi:hypothetical protein
MILTAELGFEGTAYHVWRLDTSFSQQHNSLRNCAEGPMDRQEHRVERRLVTLVQNSDVGRAAL